MRQSKGFARRRCPNVARLSVEPLERRDLMSGGTGLGPLVQVSGATPFTNFSDISQQPYSTVYLNSEVEPRIAVDPTNSLHLVAVWQQDRWNDGGCRGIMSGVTFDGGNTWTLNAVTGSTVNAGGDTLRASDPWVSFSPNGVVYVSYLTLNDPNFENPHSVAVNKSTDGGLTWGARTDVILNVNDNSHFNDKDAITADPTNSNYAYVVWDRLDFNANTGPAYLSRTTDGGATWSVAAPIFDPGPNTQTIGNEVVVEPNGTVICVLVDINYNTNTQNIEIIRSTDHGATWSGPITVSSLTSLGVTDPDNGQTVRAGDGLFDAAVNRRNGNIYITWADGRFSGFTHDDIALTYSTDGGNTWTAPFKMNKTPTNIPTIDQQAFTPSIAVANTGTVAISYYDFRKNTAAAGSSTDVWLVTASPAKLASHHPGQERRLTNTSFDVSQAPYAYGEFLGDYAGLAPMGTRFNSFGAFFGIANNPSDPTSMYFRDPAPAGPTAPALLAPAAQPTAVPGIVPALAAAPGAYAGTLDVVHALQTDRPSQAEVAPLVYSRPGPDDVAAFFARWLLDEAN